MPFTPKPSPAGCADVVEHERRLTASADALEARGLALLGNQERIVLASANQLLLTAVKARHAAAQLAHARIDRDYGEWLMEQDRRRRGEHEPRRLPRKSKP